MNVQKTKYVTDMTKEELYNLIMRAWDEAAAVGHFEEFEEFFEKAGGFLLPF